MNKDFVPYEPSLDLKELGFNEPCLAKYCKYNLTDKIELFPQSQDFFKGYFNQCTNSEYKKEAKVAAPTFSQAFRWFRDKYDIQVSIQHWCKDFKIREYHYHIEYTNNDTRHGTSSIAEHQYNIFNYEEAELELLKKLIEIVKENKNGEIIYSL